MTLLVWNSLFINSFIVIVSLIQELPAGRQQQKTVAMFVARVVFSSECPPTTGKVLAPASVTPIQV